MLLVGAGAVAVAAYYLFLKKPKAEKKSNASGDQIGAEPCSSPDNAACKAACERMGGYYEGGPLGSRKCFKNGVAISGGPFGGVRVLTGRKVITRG